MGSGVNCRQAAAAEVRLRAENSVENRGAGRTEGTKRTATVLKIVEVLSTINTVGGLQYFLCQRLRNDVSSDLVMMKMEFLVALKYGMYYRFCCLFVVFIFDIYV